jgi:hypothetical protein
MASDKSVKAYQYQWNYLKDFITDITNVNQTIEQLNNINTTSKGNPVNVYTKRNYLSAVLHQIRDSPDLKKQYLPFTRQLISDVTKISQSQLCSDSMKGKLKDIKWADIVKFKNNILLNNSISYENKLLVRLYTELDCPVRNDFSNIRVFIDEPRPTNFIGNCIMLTTKPIKYKRKKLHVIKKSEIVTDDCDYETVIYPVRNLIWLNDFKTSKYQSVSDIIQSIPDDLANDIINYCMKYGYKTLFRVSEQALSNRIKMMFSRESIHNNIGINVLRHIFIMSKTAGAPMLDERKQLARRMGHSVSTQELYRLHLE